MKIKERGWGTRSIPAFAFPVDPRIRGEQAGWLLLFVDREVVLFHLRADAFERIIHIV